MVFTPSLSVHRYPPAVWGDEEEEDDDVSWDDEGYEDEDPELAEEQEERERAMGAAGGPRGMEPDDGMSWEDGAVENMQARKQVVIEGAPAAVPSVEPEIIQQISIPAQLQPGNQQTSPQRESVAPSSPGQSQQQPAAVAATQPPRDRVTIVSEAPVSVAPQDKSMDPTQAKDTRKISITPAVARDSRPEPQLSGPLLPSAIMQQQHDDRKRTREEIEALEDAARKKANQGKPIANSPSPQSKVQSGGKLRKPEPVTSEDDNSKDRKKKSGGVFGGLFGRRKDKGKDKSSPMSGSDSGSALGAGGSTEIIVGRGSEESGLSSSQQHSGITSTQSNEQVAASRQLQGQSQQPGQGVASDAQGQRQLQQARSPDAAPPSALQSQLSQHANQLRQRDQQQQALYLQYLNRSPATPPEAQPSYGLQSASAVLPATISLSSSSSGNGLTATPTKPRPGSLVLSPGAMDGQGVGLPDLSVVRVFAGDNLQTEATFKTVLLNSSTTASGLVRQAIQRFRLPSGENENDYYLTIKQLEGSSAALLPNEQPLGVFESLVEAAMELPKVKRSSVGSISSVASNLSMHPAIRKLSMNDFTDDSAVKFYLNRKADSKSTALPGDYGDETLQVESPRDEEHDLPRSPGQFLPAVNGVTPERFTSPSYKFALQLSIHPEDLPDDMVFDPLTEAIVFKNTLRDRSHTSVASASSGVSQMRRKKIFVFPKNVTVAEVIEIGLERFGIVDGVVDGGDEIEDKLTKRRSSSRVRYGLNIDTGTGRGKFHRVYGRPWLTWDF